MPHGLDNQVNVLRRWAKHFDGAMPPDFATWAQRNPEQAIKLEINDADLYNLLKGTASAALRADALSGKFSALPPDAEEVAIKQRTAQVNELLALNPFGGKDDQGKPIKPNFTAQMQLAEVAPKIYEQKKAAAELEARGGRSQSQIDRERSEAVRLQQQMQEESMRQSYQAAQERIRAQRRHLYR